MIASNAFAAGMGYLAERFRSAISPEAQQGYRVILDEELSTEEFQIAVRLAFRHSQFWPSPQQLIDFARPPRNFEVEGSEVFDKVMALGKDTPGWGRSWSRLEVEALGDLALAAFVAIGANERLGALSASDAPHCRRDFVKAYRERAQLTERQKEIADARRAVSAPRTRRIGGAPATPTLIGDVVASVMPKAPAIEAPREVPA